MLLTPQEVLRNYSAVQEHIEQARASVNRDNREVRLIIVTKNQPVELIRPLLDTGHIHFAESRQQELEAKWPSLQTEFPEVCLHFIGPLQTNKVKQILKRCSVIESVDRLPLIHKISEAQKELTTPPGILLQVNTGEESQKSGISLANIPTLFAAANAEGLNIQGLMCIPPKDQQPSIHFKLLKNLADEYSLPTLSMGMSNDYQEAIKGGATQVRIGSRIFA